MSVIFQLFCTEDLQKLSLDDLNKIRELIRNSLKDPNGISLAVSSKKNPPVNTPPNIIDALKKRFEEVSQQIKSSHSNPSFDFDALLRRHFNQSNTEETEKESLILDWAMSCEVNNYEFYNHLVRIRDEAYKMFIDRTGQRPKGPDSLYSPFNPLHPLYNIFYDQRYSGPNPPQGAAGSSY